MGVRGVWDAGVNRGEKVIEIRQREETVVGFICVGEKKESEITDSARRVC